MKCLNCNHEVSDKNFHIHLSPYDCIKHLREEIDSIKKSLLEMEPKVYQSHRSTMKYGSGRKFKPID